MGARPVAGGHPALLLAAAGLVALAASSCGARPGRSYRAPSSPASGPLNFAVIGDFGDGSRAEHAVTRRMCSYRSKHPFGVLITVGDNVYPEGAPRRFRWRFVRPLSCLVDAGVDVHASLGNHDVVTNDGWPEISDARFGMENRNYVVREKGVGFVIADSNHLNRSWLRSALRAEAGDRWTIVVFHHPVYSGGSVHGSTPGYRPGLPRMFRRHGVDLVLNGHDHVYSVTKPLHKIRYVVTGGGGAELYPCAWRWFLEKCRSRHGFLYVHAGSKILRVKAVSSDGDLMDRFVTMGRS
jgi:hypothetical protein